jgi:hypothetical protein
MFPDFPDVWKRCIEGGIDEVLFDRLAPLVIEHHRLGEERKQYLSLKNERRRQHIIQFAQTLQKSGLAPYRDKAPEAIIIETIQRAFHSKDVNKKWRDRIFGHTDEEHRLYKSVLTFARKRFGQAKDTSARKNLPCGNPDVSAYFVEGLRRKRKTVALDAKTNTAALAYFYKQATEYLRGFNHVYFCTTVWCAIEEGEAKLIDNLQRLGCGLVYFDITGKRPLEVLKSRESDRLDPTTWNRTLTSLGWA